MPTKTAGSWDSADPSPAVLRAGKILELVAGSGGQPLRLPDLAAGLGIARSSTANICAALVDIGLLSASADGGYSLGRVVVELARSYAMTLDPIVQFTDYCRRHRDELHETLHLATLDGFDVVYLARSESPDRVVTSSRVGTRLPANATALGKVMMARLPQDELAVLLSAAEPMAKLTPATRTSRADLLEDIATARDAGYAISDEEVTTGVFGVAVAVHDLATPDGAQYAVSGSILKAWSSPDRVSRLIAEVTRVAEAVSGLS